MRKATICSGEEAFLRRFLLAVVLALFPFLTLSAMPAQAARLSGDAALSERSLGDAKAPVVIREYASLTCSHCAHFHTTILPSLKKNYIDTGLVRLVYVDFPLNGPALKAAAIARCVPEKHYFGVLSSLFSAQMNWALDEDIDRALVRQVRLAGLSEAEGQACLADQKLLEGLATKQMEAERKFGIKSTPTLVFNDGKTVLIGPDSYEKVAAIVESLLPNSKAKAAAFPAGPAVVPPSVKP